MSSRLLVFAHPLEASAFTDVGEEVLISGVGLVNAAVALSKRLSEGGVGEVIVLGTAGLVSDSGSLSQVYRVLYAEQHDFDLRGPRLALSRRALSPDTPGVLIASGDSFVRDENKREALADSGAMLVDMETYAFAAVAQSFRIEASVFKIPSDYANSAASPDEWDETALQKSRVLREFYSSLTK